MVRLRQSLSAFPALALALAASVAISLACSDDDETEADMLGVGAECAANEDCLEEQSCLTQFKGGYCGVTDCALDEDCPEGSACVAHTDGTNYCFRICTDKAECNANRDPDNESNCSANITFTDPETGANKACVPPSG
ncbi:hypothetical protein PPSIR1_24109 [Plesiocystis pacifica SIR-1]|uniref:Lipoprotein n=1 Tax=Plesiocystis pacifica SIR-1 TaxID=391625 RepID=A6GJS7_9BACT|nr:hypothetical protein [Plesiocystis pacifica]EDM73880.1 hypothetical protein PPSIR1_24109 [Plesiocystis pacifica SIR-1]